MLRKFCLSVLLAFAVALPSMQAARVTVDARLDSVSMMIGHQNRFYLEIFAPEAARVDVPVCLDDTLVTGVYILKRSPLDSTDIDNARKKLSLEYLLTSFDEGLYYIPPVDVTIDGEVYESNYLTLRVSTYEVDTTSMAIFDIKPVEKAPFVIWDYVAPVGFSLTGLARVLAGLFFWRRFRNKPEETETVDPETLLPPHVAALQALEVIREEKIWTQGRYKEFYTQLTDVMRKYISRRFEVSAMEMTTTEIMTALKNAPWAKGVLKQLQEMLELADFVKFAKLNPLPEENARSMASAYEFVNETKEEEKAEAADDVAADAASDAVKAGKEGTI